MADSLRGYRGVGNSVTLSTIHNESCAKMKWMCSTVSNYDDFVILKNPESPRGFNVYLPRPILSRFLEFVAVHICRLTHFTSGSVHLLAVANSGVPLATAVLMHRKVHSLPGHQDDALSIVDPYRHNFLVGSEIKARIQVIVDNSIKSVKTLNHVRHQMQAENLPVARYVLKLVDYEDVYEAELNEHLSEAGLEILSVFTLSDIVVGMSSERSALTLRFLREMGYERYV